MTTNIDKVSYLANFATFFQHDAFSEMYRILYTDDDNNCFVVTDFDTCGEELSVNYADVDLNAAKFYILKELE